MHVQPPGTRHTPRAGAHCHTSLSLTSLKSRQLPFEAHWHSGTGRKRSKVAVYARPVPRYTPNTASWSVLPNELEELILANLSLTDLARISTTHSSFQRVYCEHLARDQKTRCNLAVECFGRERLSCIATLIRRFVKGEALGMDLDDVSLAAGCCLCEGGLLHKGTAEPCVPPDWSARAGACTVWVSARRQGTCTTLSFRVRVREGSEVVMRINDRQRAGSILVNPNNAACFVGVALAQPVVSGCFAPGLDRVFTFVHIFRWGFLTQVGVDAMTAPLLPFVSKFTVTNPARGQLPRVKERVHVGHVGSMWKKRITLNVVTHAEPPPVWSWCTPS
jgi:hypothetical protein